jgi:hypothetical protein
MELGARCTGIGDRPPSKKDNGHTASLGVRWSEQTSGTRRRPHLHFGDTAIKLQAIVVHSMRRVVIGTISVALVALAIQLSAEAADNPNTSWYHVVSFRFKPGKTTEALQIIHEHFHRVKKAIGRKLMPFDYTTGEWAHVVYFPSDTEKMDIVPPQTTFMEALAKQEGGKEQT